MDAKAVLEACARVADPQINMLDFIGALYALNPSVAFFEELAAYLLLSKFSDIHDDTITGVIASKRLSDYLPSILQEEIPVSRTFTCNIPQTFTVTLGKKVEA